MSFEPSVLSFFGAQHSSPFVILSEAGSFAFANESAQSKDLCTLYFCPARIQAFSGERSIATEFVCELLDGPLVGLRDKGSFDFARTSLREARVTLRMTVC